MSTTPRTRRAATPWCRNVSARLNDGRPDPAGDFWVGSMQNNVAPDGRLLFPHAPAAEGRHEFSAVIELLREPLGGLVGVLRTLRDAVGQLGASSSGIEQLDEQLCLLLERLSLLAADDSWDGLRWLDVQCLKRFEKSFADCSEQQRMEMVDEIAWPKKAKPEMAQGVAFFNLMRNLTATGFFTSKIGVADLGYKGNTPNKWNGVPDEVLKQYNLAYTERELKECAKYV